MAVIAAKATICVATTESGTSWRGNLTLRMRFAFSTRLRAAVCTEEAKNAHGGSPQRRKSQ